MFEDLARDAEHLAAAVRVNANRSIDVVVHALLTAAIDDTLGSLGRVCAARPGVGDRYDVELPAMYRPPVPRGTAVIWVDDDVLDDVAKDGWFDQFDEPTRVRDALAALDQRAFAIERDAESSTWASSGLLDLVLEVLSAAMAHKRAS
ncbi:hypothetical protein [Cellulomonas algicola]|uniref:hypothetical protein n=1 Tax=Cellulomonas algicola TaxID=2071633 RepID=UPI00190FB7EB|nr:hypothetical protein [Cellulomonas algicola]